MKKLLLFILFSVLLVSLLILSSCENNKPTVTEHQHTYNMEVIETKYLKSNANCISKAIYYKSCSCGEFLNDGTAQTFVAGDIDLNNHVTTDIAYKDNGDGTHSEVHACCKTSIGEPTSHVFESYIRVPNTNYHRSTCICGKISISNCDGGTATCIEKAICEACHETYGELNATNHATTDVEYKDNGDGTHSEVHACCKTSIGEYAPHVFGNWVQVEGANKDERTCVCGKKEVREYKLNAPPIIEVACNADGTTASQFDLTTIKSSSGIFAMGIVEKIGGGNVNFADAEQTTLLIKAGEKYTFTNAYGSVMIRANSRTDGKLIDFTTANDAELLKLTDVVYNEVMDAPQSEAAYSFGLAPQKFSIEFNTNGIIPNTNTRTLTFCVHNIDGGSAQNLIINAIDKTGTYTFEKINVPALSWKARYVVLYLPSGMNVSDLKLEIDKKSNISVKLYDFIVKEVYGNEIFSLDFSNASDKNYIQKIESTGFDKNTGSITGGVWMRMGDYSGKNFAFSIPAVILPSYILEKDGIKFSVDLYTQNGSHTLTAKVDSKQSYTFTGNNFNGGYKTITFDVPVDSNFRFDYIVDNSWADIGIDNIKLVIAHNHYAQKDYQFTYADNGDGQHTVKYACCEEEYGIFEHEKGDGYIYVPNTNTYEYICPLCNGKGYVTSHLIGGQIHEVSCDKQSGTAQFDLTSLKSDRGDYVAGTVVKLGGGDVNYADSNKNILIVNAGEIYNFTNVFGTTEIRGSLKDSCIYFDGTTPGNELITITAVSNGDAPTFDDLTNAIVTTSTSAWKFAIEFRSNGVVSLQNDRSFIIRVHNTSANNIEKLEFDVIDKSNNLVFESTGVGLLSGDYVSYLIYLPKNTELSNLKIMINTNEQTSIAVDCFRTIINSVDGEILVADFAHELDNYLLPAAEAFAQSNGVFELNTLDSDLEYSFSMPVLVLPNTISSKASRTVVMDIKNELGNSISINIDNVSKEIAFNDDFVSYTINAYNMSGKKVSLVLQSGLSGKICIDNIKIVLSEYTDEIGDMEAAVDFIINVEPGRDVRILQITDTQIIDPGQCRYPDRLGGNVTPLTLEDFENGCFKYIREAIERTNPDLIIFTGDITYGEFDDNGETLLKIIQYMESFNIPWAPIFGNHDNESKKGVTWQCQQFENAKNCLFKRGDVTGNGNYSIGIMQDGKLIKVVYMMDSNGCRNAYDYEYKPELGGYNQNEKVKTSIGFGDDQVEWLNRKSSEIDLIAGYSVSKFIAFHIPLAEYSFAAYEKGYVDTADINNKTLFDLPGETDDKNADFGSKGEYFGVVVYDGLWDILKQNGFDGVFAGHAHKCNFSIVYQGIRLTFGLKTSTFDYHSSQQLGGTLITVENSNGDFYVQHVYHKEV